MDSRLLNFVHDWQQLIGALLGALTPISLWFLSQWALKKKKKKDALELIDTNAAICLNNANEIRKTITKFSDISVKNLIAEIENNTINNAYSINFAFFPLFNAEPIKSELIGVNTKSNYLNNHLLQAYLMSKDFVYVINDMRRQFEWALQMNKETAIAKLNNPKNNNQQFKDSMEGFQKMVKDDFLGKSIESYFQVLIKLIVALRLFRKMPFVIWRLKFDSDLKFFKNKNAERKYKGGSANKIDEYIDAPVREMRESLDKQPK